MIKQIIKLCGVLFMFIASSSGENIMKTKSAIETLKKIELLSENAIIFFDVDDTLITPESTSFRKLPNIIDEIKNERKNYKNFAEILSNWRLQRKIMLLDHDWPKVLNKLKEKYRVYGLTKMDAGKFGNIESMQEWRYKELKSCDLEFSNDIYNIEMGINNPVFYKGIFLTGSFSKSDTIKAYQSYLKTDKIVLVDDRLDHLEDVEQYCKNNSIDFVGILYEGLEHLSGKIDPTLAQFQKEYLIKHAKWLEDEEANALRNNSK